MRTRTKVKIGGRSAKALVEHPALRRATVAVTPPVAKAGLRIGGRRARKRALAQAERLQEVARTAGDALTTYGPRAAEALTTYGPQVAEALTSYGPQAAEALGLIEHPKRRRAPVFLAGALFGGAVALLLEPKGGSARRARVAALASSAGSSTPASTSTSTSPPAPATPASTAATAANPEVPTSSQV